ncbi:MAG: PEP-CTERM sorting domain-containing protein [Brasilonema angustatum HA4187-MV1]|nr:PEP-CTERM sorting domain-containing protein [Brasilonema angustatum HA4187-MV1]
MKPFIRVLTLGSTTVLGLSVVAGSAHATTFTLTSPTSGGTLGNGFTPVGGIVLDLIGQNNTRVTSQLAANQLYIGYANNNPLTIGTQTGFNSSVISALGGGIKEAAIRFSLYDGDSASGDFDFNDNTLQVNGLNFGNWSSVNAENTDDQGNAASGGLSSGGFRNETLDTGWFYSNNATLLTNLYNSFVNTQKVVYQVQDIDPYDNYYDFTQGVSSNFTNVGQGPAVQPSNPVPEPITILGSLAAGSFGVALRRKYNKQEQKETAKV